MMRYVFRGTVAIAALAMACGVAATAAQTKDKVALDNDFIVKAMTCTHAEVMYSELAEKHAASDKVKAFARQVIKDHKDVDSNLAKAAADHKVGVVAGTEKETKDELKRLSGLQGAAFDKAYMQRMIDDHEAAITMFESQTKLGKDAKLNDFAKTTLPKIRDHLKEAKSIASDLK
jgi:putative membrane protein